MSRKTIIAKSLICIDEIYPDNDLINQSFFPVESFIDEATRWIIDTAPVHRLGLGNSFSPEFISLNHGVGKFALPDDFGRLLYLLVADWHRPVLNPIYDTDISYRQMSNHVLRGNYVRPVAVICNGKTQLEFYSTSIKEITDLNIIMRYMPYDADKLVADVEDITAWKLAELVLMSMSDIAAAQICTSHIAEMQQILQS